MKAAIVIDLSGNQLSGNIPSTIGEILSGGSFPNFTAQSFMGNKALCGPACLQVPPCHSKSGQPSNTKSRLLRFILPAVASALLVVAFVFLLVRCPRRRRKTPIPEALPLTAIQRSVSFLELLRATNEFHESESVAQTKTLATIGGDGHSLNKEHRVTSVMELALQRANESPEERINMVEILARLKNIKGEFLTERERRRP
ncbi:hypothetical protein D5086_012045 [Populus alba]|uniref:Uncharacterized protein n=1 Tax=Populus alba TaxID=43335 RepID=A0ACC4C1L9_POPAL